jgi:porin
MFVSRIPAAQRGAAALVLAAALARFATSPAAAADGLLGGAPGLTLNAEEASELIANLTGGIRRGAEYDGRTLVTLELDTEKASMWSGGTFHASALQIHGRDISADNLAVLQTITNVNAARASRLWELWYQQELPLAGADVKIGQQSLDQDFLVTEDSSIFLNALTGWPAVPSNDFYAGSPVYPLSSLGIRLEAKPADKVTVLAGVFDDNPPGGPFLNDPQTRDGEASGTRFNLGTGALSLVELQYAATPMDLSGTYKFGLWYDTGPFPDQRFDTAGRSLAAPGSTGVPRMHPGNYGAYAVLEQTVWQHKPHSLALYARAVGAPGDRNLVEFSFDAGFLLTGPLPGRDKDRFGIGYGIAKVSGTAAALDRDVALFGGSPHPVRSAEQVIEATYEWRVTSWWRLQPDFQYVISPSGGIPNPLKPTRQIGDETVVGLRTTFSF